MKNIAILASEYVALFELGCAVELFALPRPELKNWYRSEVVSFTEQPLNSAGGLTVECKRIQNLDNYDMLVIPSWPVSDTAVDKQMGKAIKRLYQRGGRILSFCSGAFLMAELGLLDNRQATTHWRYAQQFKQRYTLSHYVDDVLYLYDGQLGCSAGSAAAIDLGIAVIAKDYGHKVANQVARRLVLAAHRAGGQAQFVETPVAIKPNHLAKTLDWAITHLTQGIKVADMAKQTNMSRRSFDRKFRSAMNISPQQWLTLQKINIAKQLLESSKDSIEQVALKSGFETSLSLRLNFQKTLQLAPSRYRDQFNLQTEQPT